jgi:class 3 adenylate cyclase/tetratricopeptide (TPR) repeat protein
MPDNGEVSTLSDRPIPATSAETLKPYVPRLLIQWLKETPEARHLAIDGSLVFVDISGFTALTERLARQGKVGAELMRDTLDGVFTALLDEAYDWGAGLLKWGGDALLLLFDGPGHAPRAARACWEMQRTIERVGRLRVTGGTVTLRMSIGITTGRLDFFTAGSVHRELLITGPGATETVTIEAIADAGEIGISHALAALLDPACVGPPKEQALLLAAPPEIDRQRAPDVGSVEGIDIASCIPVAARAHVLLEHSEPEHRTITAAFIDMMDTDELLERLGPEAFAVALDERICAIQEAAQRFDVPFYETDVGKSSVKALLTAGAPSSTGHDEERMLRALREIMDQPGVIPMRIGVNTGKVFTGDFGPPYRRAYRVFGDAINTAARVMSKADAGQILSTAIVLERSRTTFATTPIEPFRAKGKANLVHASVVGPVSGVREGRRAETPLIGRNAELGALLEVMREVREGKGWIVEISSEPGLGRSRLVHELIDRCSDIAVLHAHCEEYEALTPYFAFRQPMFAVLGLEPNADTPEVEARLRDAVARIDPTLMPWLPLLGILVGLVLPPTPETARLDDRFLRETLADVAMRFLASSLTGRPAMFVIEDVHFMDDASADLLKRLSLAGADLRQLLLVTHSEPGTTWAPLAEEGLRCLSFTLGPIRQEDAAEIVRLATDDQPLSPNDVDEIARRSAGSPLFLFELLDMVRETGTTEALPDSVESVIAGEIDRLSPSDRTVLRYASVLGASFDTALLATAVRDDVELDAGVWERLHALVGGDPLGEMRFKNTLVRDSAYEGLPFRRRRVLHERVGEAIEALSGSSMDEEISALALHFFEARRDDKAWQYCRLAGDRAKAVVANVEAARFYRRALEAARRRRDIPPRERAEVWKSLGAVQDSAGRFADAYDALRRATKLLNDDPAAQAETYENRTRARIRSGEYGRALRETSIGLRVVSGQDTPAAAGARSRLQAQRAELRLLQGHPREAMALALRAAEEGERIGELEAVARAYTALDGAYQMLGQPEKATNERKAVDIWEQLGRLRSVGIVELNLGVQAYADGHWDEAIDWYERSRTDCAAAGDRQNVAIASANLGEVLVSRGALDEAEVILTDARRALRAAGLTPYALFAETQLARARLDRGDAEGALDALARIVDEAQGVGHAGIVLEIAVYFAHAATLAGQPERGLEVLNDAADAAGDEAVMLSVPVDRVRGAALVALGRVDEARARFEQALTGARQQSLLYEQLLILRERAACARQSGEAPNAEELDEADRLAELLGITR